MVCRLRQWKFLKYWQISSLHLKFCKPLLYSRKKVFKKLVVLIKQFEFKLFEQSSYVLHPVNTNNARPLRFTATAGTKLVRAKKFTDLNHHTHRQITLQPVGILRARNITRSSLHSLSNIPHCSIPREGGLLLFPLWLSVLPN